MNNGDFIALPANNTWPSVAMVGFPAVRAVIFNNSIDGVADRLYTNHQSFPASNSFFYSSDWSLEGWVYIDGPLGRGENPWIQWATRPGTSCNVANIGVGANAGYGAGGHWGTGCDVFYSGPTDATFYDTAVGGWQPTPNKWHHIALTYSGASGNPTYQENLYVDGWLMGTWNARVLAIAKSAPIILGSFVAGNGAGNVDVAGRIAVARTRMHDGVLSDADVRYNYLTEGIQFQATPSTTATVTQTPSVTASPSNTPSNTPT